MQLTPGVTATKQRAVRLMANTEHVEWSLEGAEQQKVSTRRSTRSND